MLGVADSAFQSSLIQDAQRVGKLERFFRPRTLAADEVQASGLRTGSARMAGRSGRDPIGDNRAHLDNSSACVTDACRSTVAAQGREQHVRRTRLKGVARNCCPFRLATQRMDGARKEP